MAEGTKKPAAKAPASKDKAPAAAQAKGPAKAAAKGASAGKGAATAAAPEGERCSVDKCKQPIRAKGLCRKHYLAWRRGDLGKKHRYKTCSKEGCRKPAQFAGRCEEHRKGAAAEAAPAAAG
jgi:hypothetical protein